MFPMNIQGCLPLGLTGFNTIIIIDVVFTGGAICTITKAITSFLVFLLTVLLKEVQFPSWAIYHWLYSTTFLYYVFFTETLWKVPHVKKPFLLSLEFSEMSGLGKGSHSSIIHVTETN